MHLNMGCRYAMRRLKELISHQGLGRAVGSNANLGFDDGQEVSVLATAAPIARLQIQQGALSRAELQGCRACLLNKGHVRRILKKDGLEDYRVRPWPSDCGQGLGELARERVRELPQVGFTHLVERATRGRRCAQGSCDDARRADTHEPSGGASHCSSPHHSQGVESRIGPGHAERQKPSGPSCEK